MNNNAQTTLRRKNRKKNTEEKRVYYSPIENMSGAQLVIGLILRTFIVYIGIVGLTSFICGSAGLMTSGAWWAVSVSPWHIALFALPPALACGVASLGVPFACTTAAVYVGAYTGIIASLFGNPIEFTVQSALRIYNFALYTVSSYGFYSVGNFMVNDGYDYSNGALAETDPQRFCGVFLICTIIGLVLFFTVQKKVRIIPLVVFITAIMTPIMSYNLAIGTSGIGFTTIFVCAAIAMKIYDKRYSGRIERRQNRKAEKDAARKIKRTERLSKKLAKKEQKETADRIFYAAIDAGADLKKARSAKRLFLKSKRDEKKNRKKALKTAAKLEKNKQRLKKSELKKEKKRLAKLKKTDKNKAAAALKELKNQKKQEKFDKKSSSAKKRAEKRQKRREETKKRRRVSFAGGYGAAGVALCVFFAVVIPMAAVSEPFKTIDPINNKIQIARAYFTAYLKGNDVDLNDLSAYGYGELTPRELSFAPLEYEDIEMFRVETEGSANIYLRSWVGTNFDREAGKWLGADHDEVLAYRSHFGLDFTPDEISTAFYKSVFPSTASFTETNDYKNFSKYGFNMQQVNVWRNRGNGLLLFVPAHMDSDLGLLKYGYLEDNEYKYSNYFDGIYSSRFYRYGRGYSTVSFVSNYSREGVGDSIENGIEYWQRCKDFILANYNYTNYNIDKALSDFFLSLQNDRVDYVGTNLCYRFFNTMTAEERDKVIEMYKLEEKYAEYARETYTKTFESDAVKKVADEIFAQLPGDTIYDTVRAVADYFNENYTYSMEPDSSMYDGQKPVLDAFLTDVKEGYCTHFATAACAILREFGIPTRYCEGYVASDFEEATGGKSASMRTYVKDSDAHAWIEVYINGMGWVQFEVTPGDYYDGMYNSSSATIDPVVQPDDNNKTPTPLPVPVTPPGEVDIEMPDPVDDETVDKGDIMWFMKRIAAAAAVAAVIMIIYFIVKHIRKKAERAVAERFRVIDIARSEERYNDERVDNRSVARKIDDMLLSVFTVMGAPPEKGELSEEYAVRMQENYGRLSLIDVGEVIRIMQKEEFGNGLSFEEMYMCAEYLSDITSAVYNELSIWQKIKLRYIQRKI